ncbi:MAG: hypothetical protein HC921_03200 [Synechococcaceae cyanobacterium SM2_3_1]|nr:hypothetical protein [Synechococcaceae cyanobacterium SM2_3_1]
MSLYSPQFVLNIATGSVSFPLAAAGAHALNDALRQIMERLQGAGTQGKKTPQPSVDVNLQQEGLLLNLFCNPNIWPAPHAAKVLFTVKTDVMRVSTEVELPRLLEDLSDYLESL